jgi:hypothetical protein
MKNCPEFYELRVRLLAYGRPDRGADDAKMHAKEFAYILETRAPWLLRQPGSRRGASRAAWPWTEIC